MKHTSYPAMAWPMALRLLALLAAVYLVLTVGARSVIAEAPDHSRLIAGPTAWLLTASTDLGPAHKNGEVDDFSLEDPNAVSTRGRLLVMTAVKNGLALMAVAEGPMIRFTPRTSGHPSAVNLMIAQLMGNSVNSFTWNKPASQ